MNSLVPRPSLRYTHVYRREGLGTRLDYELLFMHIINPCKPMRKPHTYCMRGTVNQVFVQTYTSERGGMQSQGSGVASMHCVTNPDYLLIR